MKVEIQEGFKVVTPDEGKVLHNEDTYATILYMPVNGDTSIWKEVPYEDSLNQN